MTNLRLITKRSTILFDLDKTLIDTSKLVHEFINPALAKKLRVETAAVENIDRQYKSGLKIFSAFNPWEFLELLATKFNTDQQELENVFFAPKFYPQSVYPETLPVLEKYQKTYKLGIYSEGVMAWQKVKLKLAKLDKFFANEMVFISPNKKSPQLIAKLPAKAVVVDDRLDYIDQLKLRKDIYPVWLDRNCSHQQVDAHTITNLSELEEVLKI
jgi:FMN phosphatase YigB (HAD superfamily)